MPRRSYAIKVEVGGKYSILDSDPPRCGEQALTISPRGKECYRADKLSLVELAEAMGHLYRGASENVPEEVSIDEKVGIEFTYDAEDVRKRKGLQALLTLTRSMRSWFIELETERRRRKGLKENMKRAREYLG